MAHKSLRELRPRTARALMRAAQQLRAQNGLTVRAQAAQIGTSLGNWNRFERSGNCGIDMLIRMHRATGKSFEELLGVTPTRR